MSGEQSAPDRPPIRAPLPPIDIQKLLGTIVKRHGIMVKEDDPAFILITMLEEVSKAHLGHLTTELEKALDGITASSAEQKEASRLIAERIVNEGGQFIAERIQTAGLSMGPAITSAVILGLQPTLSAVNARAAEAAKARFAALIAAGVAVFALVGTAGLYFGALAS